MRNLKKVALIFFTSIIVLSVFNLSDASTGVVNTPAVRIREKASTDSEILTKAYENEEIDILGEEGDWYKVKVNGKTGYASKSLIKLADSKDNAKNETTGKNNSASNTSTNNNSSKDNVSTYEIPEDTDNTDEKKVVKEDVSLKLLPNFASNNIKLMSKGQEIEVKKEMNNWAEITVNGISGWILKNKIALASEVTTVDTTDTKPEETDKTPEENTTEEKEPEKDEKTEKDNEKENTTQTGVARNSKGTVNVETANVRKEADIKSSIIHHLDEGDEVTIVEEIGDWYKITNNEVTSGYVSKKLITLSDVTSRSSAESREEKESNQTASSATGLAVVEFAKQYLGTKYVLGGKTPETGFDCSGYTRYVFKNFGYSLGTVAANQNTVGTEISREDLKEGDLILFYDEAKTKIGHTGIYIGGDQFIHAANPERGVVIDGFSTNSYYSTRFVTARRIVE